LATLRFWPTIFSERTIAHQQRDTYPVEDRQRDGGTVEAKTQDSADRQQAEKRRAARPTPTQRAWLRAGLNQAGGKLPLFDKRGQRVSERTIRSCIEQGWAEQWFDNPIKPDWLVCKLTEDGRKTVA
jgi:hypothetical protein